MIQLGTLTIRNFLSVGAIEQVVDLSCGGWTLILGENADVGGANSRNGVGKTTFMQALSYVLFNEPLTKIKLDNLVNNINGKGMLVTHDFRAHGKRYRIERGRKPNVLRWFVNGSEVNDAEGENKHTQAEIERVLGMSHDLFRHIVALNTTTTPFLREKASEQRVIIEELIRITLLSEKADTLKKVMDKTKEQVRDEESKIKADTESNARIERAIAQAEQQCSDWQAKQDGLLAQCLEAAETVAEIDIDAELAVFEHIDAWTLREREIDERRRATEERKAQVKAQTTYQRAELARLEAQARATNSGEIARLERQAQLYRTEADQDIQPEIVRRERDIARYREEAERYVQSRDRLSAEHDAILAQLSDPDAHTCSTCGQGLAGTGHLEKVIANLTEQAERVQASVDDCETRRLASEKNITFTETEIRTLEADQVQKRDALLAKAAEVEAEIVAARRSQQERAQQAAAAITAVQEQIALLAGQEEQIMASTQALDALYADLGACPASSYRSRDEVRAIARERDTLLRRLETLMAEMNPHASKIDALRATLAVISHDRLNELALRLKHEAFLHKLLSAKDSFVRKEVIDQNLAYLNCRLNHYLEQLGLPHEVTFLPDLGVEIALLGRDFDFEQLSSGERNRVVLATSWAFRDIWESLNGGLNVALCDELIDSGMDDAGAEAALSILQRMTTAGKSVFLISHKENLISRADQVLLVRKENQFASFISQSM